MLYSEVVGPFWMISQFQGFFGVLNSKKEKKIGFGPPPGADLGGEGGGGQKLPLLSEAHMACRVSD